MIISRKSGFTLKSISLLSLVALALLTIFSCSKESSINSKASLTVMLTDAPAGYDQVNVDVQGVELTNSAGGKILLNAKPGIYNLLEFANGAKTMLATGALEAGAIEQIRLILGSNNSVMVNGVVHPLSTPSAQQSGLKLQVHKTFEPGVDYSLTLDFDALKSVVVKGNGEYQLKPVIRVIDEAISGSIRGSVLPDSIAATITALRDTLSYSTVTNEEGKFLLSGLPAGTYNITITPALPFQPVTILNKQVTIGVSTDLGAIQLH
jgi:hypothetical protein